MTPPPLPLLGRDLISEILVRLPPDEPEHLFRAALVCKPWLRTIASGAFQRRYGEFHKVPPLLGFIVNVIARDHPHRFTPTTALPAFTLPVTSSRPPRPHLDCRHGRVLTIMEVAAAPCFEYLVWNPVTGVEHRVPMGSVASEYAAVFCPAVGCNHQRCHEGPFRVVEVGQYPSPSGDVFSAMVYSSVTGSWSDQVTFKPAQSRTRVLRLLYQAPVIGNDVFLHILPKMGIVKYNWIENSLSMDTPAPPGLCAGKVSVILMVIEDNCLGLAGIDDAKLHIWTKVAAEWIQHRVIDLVSVPPNLTRSSYPEVCGFAEGVGCIFIETVSGLFMMCMNSEVVELVRVDRVGMYSRVLPYMSFYMPDISNAVQQVMRTINPTTKLEHMTVEATSHDKGMMKSLVAEYESSMSMQHRAPGIEHRAQDIRNAVQQVMPTMDATTRLERMTVKATSDNKGMVKSLVANYEGSTSMQHQSPAKTERIVHSASGSASTNLSAPDGDKEMLNEEVNT